ncbi:Uncharacterised protein [Yersinia aldovae]|uniref:hypothetical protein n=1 Tax=Yersinia aldovae TaxID=29483 RepID=UPI0005DC72B6|nr:hypothetical protein [Yersinia aldovae]CNJ04125.1 Uncharacterised protein [Yersinia aldovae]
MGKVSYLNELTDAYMSEGANQREKCSSQYKNLPPVRWLEVMKAHNRKAMRKERRSAGKSNRLGARRTAIGMVRYLNYLNAMSVTCRRNRAVHAYGDHNE